MSDQRPTRTQPDARTRAAEAADADVAAAAGSGPTDAEERAADSNPPLEAEVAEQYEEMVERGANQRGEGRVP
jgi:hypothetical protein